MCRRRGRRPADPPVRPPIARFAAALLGDLRTLRRIPYPGRPPSTGQTLRTALLALLGDFAADAAWHQRNPHTRPLPPRPSSSRCARRCSRRWRRIWTPPSRKRENAVLAAVVLVAHPDLALHRGHLAARTRVILTEVDYLAYNARQAGACHTIKAWGHDTRSLIPEPVDWLADGTDDPRSELGDPNTPTPGWNPLVEGPRSLVAIRA
ncbi:hypothetical protein ACU686_11895 [Yinghuangia aomiensis]